MRRRTLVVEAMALAVLLLSACESSTQPVAGTSPGPSTRPSPPNSLIVLTVSDLSGKTVLRLIQPTGRVVASTQFEAPPRPASRVCMPLMQPAVRVAGGAAFFADKTGLVRKLSPDGSVTPVATFKLANAQQALSYAVSPDGGKLIAIVLSTPPLLDGPGTWSLDLETATAGGSTAVVLHRDLGSTYPFPTIVTGWDEAGPTATLSSAICTQDTIPSLRYNGLLIRLGMDGSHLERIGGPDCAAWDELVDGTVLCRGKNPGQFNVRSRDGTVLWSGAGDFMFNVALSPDGSGVESALGTIVLRDSVQRTSQARTGQPHWQFAGWAGPEAVVVGRPDGHIGLSPARDLNAFQDLGIRGAIQNVEAVGTIPIPTS